MENLAEIFPSLGKLLLCGSGVWLENDVGLLPGQRLTVGGWLDQLVAEQGWIIAWRDIAGWNFRVINRTPTDALVGDDGPCRQVGAGTQNGSVVSEIPMPVEKTHQSNHDHCRERKGWWNTNPQNDAELGMDAFQQLTPVWRFLFNRGKLAG